MTIDIPTLAYRDRVAAFLADSPGRLLIDGALVVRVSQDLQSEPNHFASIHGTSNE